MGTVVACVRVAKQGPAILLSGHLEGDVPILIYRVADYDAAIARLREAGIERHPPARDPARAVRELPRARRPARRDLRAHAARGGRRASTAGSTTDYARAGAMEEACSVRILRDVARAGPARARRPGSRTRTSSRSRTWARGSSRSTTGRSTVDRGRRPRPTSASPCPRRSSASSWPASRTRCAAVMTGKIKVKGDLGAATKLKTLLG